MMKVPFSIIAALALLFTAFSQPAQATGNTCVYVLGTIAGRTVTTPALLIPVPDSSFTVDPARVHVDEMNHVILGYSLTVPGAEADPEPQSLYVPGVTADVPSFSTTLADLDLADYRCASYGAMTPAVPVYIPASALDAPGIAYDVPAIYMNIMGQERVVGGQVIVHDGRTIIVPGVNTIVPPQQVETPDQTIIVDLNGVLQPIDHMIPR
jgi:hypothetical protein